MVVWKSEPGVFELLNQLTGTDLRSLTVPAPAKKSSWKNSAPVHQATVLPTTNVLPPMNLPTPSVLQNPINNGLNISLPPMTKNVSVASHLSSLLDSLSIPMERVQRTSDNDLIDNNGDTRIGMWGPTAKLEVELGNYIEQYGEKNVKENVRVTIGDNTAVIITRLTN